MIQYDEAFSIIRSSAKTLSMETVPFQKTLGRILASDLKSKEMLPPFSNSAMDGFAYRLSDLSRTNSPHQLKILGTIAAGDSIGQKSTTGNNETWEIMTGAQVPCDCDAVIKVEDTRKEGDGVEFLKVGKVGENIRSAGEDFQIGDIVTKSGTRIFPEHLMAFAALGIQDVPVFRQPTVSVLSTGAELANVPALNSGQIRNSTGPYLTAELSRLGTTPTFLGAIADDPKLFLDVIKEQVDKGVDAILSTGAVSMGKYDFVATALRDLGAEILFHKVAIRPGKPLLFAKIGKTAFFGVPGNPISSAVALRFFTEPFLRQLQGLASERGVKVVLENPIKKPEGLRCFFKARTHFENGHRTVEIIKGQESFRISPFLNANSWAVLPEEGKELDQGTEIEVYPLHSWAQKEDYI